MTKVSTGLVGKFSAKFGDRVVLMRNVSRDKVASVEFTEGYITALGGGANKGREILYVRLSSAPIRSPRDLGEWHFLANFDSYEIVPMNKE